MTQEQRLYALKKTRRVITAVELRWGLAKPPHKSLAEQMWKDLRADSRKTTDEAK